MVQEKIGFRIKELRNNLGLSQEELADMAGLDRTYITSVDNDWNFRKNYYPVGSNV